MDNERVGVGHAARYGLVDLGHGFAKLDLVAEHAINGVGVPSARIMETPRLRLQLLETAFRVDEDGIFGMLADVELGLELLRCLLRNARVSQSRPMRRQQSSHEGGGGRESRGVTYANHALLEAAKAHVV